MINSADPELYEHLSLIVAAYEEQAIRSGKRNGFIAAAQGPVMGFEQLLLHTDGILAKTQRNSEPRRDASETGRLRLEREGSLTDPEQDFRLRLESDPIEADFNVDLLELLGEQGRVGDFASRYLSECLGCNGRLQFGWQLKPINFLAAVDKLLDQIEAGLDRFLNRLDPWNQLSGLCDLLNSFRVFCIQDILMMLMSVKLLMRQYMQNAIKIKLDWTAVFGPLLKAVVDGITDLMGEASAIISAPLQCAEASLATADQIYRQTREILDDIQSLASLPPPVIDAQIAVSSMNVRWQNGAVVTTSSTNLPRPPQDRNQSSAETFAAATRNPNQRSADFFGDVEPGTNITTGFTVDAKTTILEALRDSRFGAATPIQKILVPLQEARLWIQKQIDKLNQMVESLNALAGGGLVADLDNLGVLLFLADVINLIGLIASMVRAGDRRTDWCRVLSDQPQMLEDRLRRISSDVTVENQDDILILRKGREVVGQVPLCANKRTESNNQLLNQWIADLEKRR